MLQITCSVKNQIKYYDRLKLFIFTRETSNRTIPGHSLYMTTITQCTEGTHYNVVNGELPRFGNATSFDFQRDSSFATK